MLKSVIAFVDGENLTLRYQEMVAAGRVPSPDVNHIKDSFVWVPAITSCTEFDLTRVLYYTSVVGDDTRVSQVSAQIGATVFRSVAGGTIGKAQIIPRVHKKPANSSLKQSHAKFLSAYRQGVVYCFSRTASVETGFES